MSDKLTARLLLRVDDQTSREVRSFADSTERTLNGALRFLIKAGLKHEVSVSGGKKRLIVSTPGNRKAGAA